MAKVIPALQSRCTRFRFGPLTDASVSAKLTEVCQNEQLVVDSEAQQAIVKLAKGDMRKVMNILESCSLTYKEIPLAKIFEVTGRPSPTDIDQIFNALMNEDYRSALAVFTEIKTNKSLALEDIVRDLHKCVMECSFEEQMKMFLVSRLSEIEFRLASGTNERAQVASVVGAFLEIRSVPAN